MGQRQKKKEEEHSQFNTCSLNTAVTILFYFSNYIFQFSAKKLPKDVNQHGVFACNELDLKEVDVYGFDYDYTLACYKPSLHYLLYNLGRDMLIERFKVRGNRRIFQATLYSNYIIISHNGRDVFMHLVFIYTETIDSSLSFKIKYLRMLNIFSVCFFFHLDLLSQPIHSTIHVPVPDNSTLKQLQR